MLIDVRPLYFKESSPNKAEKNIRLTKKLILIEEKKRKKWPPLVQQ